MSSITFKNLSAKGSSDRLGLAWGGWERLSWDSTVNFQSRLFRKGKD